MSTLRNKIDFALVLRVKNANPNGDPLNGNRPRTDYEGLGTPSMHTYVGRVAEGQAVLDAARAAMRLPSTSLDPHGFSIECDGSVPIRIGSAEY